MSGRAPADGPAEAPALTVVVPAFNEELRLGPTLERLTAYLAGTGRPYEVVVVDDGSRDRTAEVARAAAARDPAVRLVQLPRNRGKGAAVRAGMLEGRAPWLLLCDADLSTPIEEVEKLQARADASGAEVVLGSRAHPDSDIQVRQPWAREMMGRTFNVLVRALAVRGFKDTQCGFKLFSRRAAQEVFRRQRIDGFAFDVEVLLLARAAGLRVAEVPVVWRHFDESRVSMMTDAPRMLLDLVVLRLRRWRAPVRRAARRSRTGG